MYFRLNNALVPFMDLIKKLFELFLDVFVSMFIDETFIYWRNKEDHATHLRFVLQTLKYRELYSNFSKCDF